MSEAEPKRFGLPLGYVTILALIISPIAGASMTMLCIALLASALQYQPFADFGDAIVRGAFFGGAVGIVPALVLGLPAHVALLDKRIIGLGPYIGVFVGIAMVVFLVTAMFSGMGSMFATLPIAVVLIAAMYSFAGAVSGLIFWLIRRPDRGAKREGA